MKLKIGKRKNCINNRNYSKCILFREQKLAGMITQILNLRKARTKLEGQIDSLAKELEQAKESIKEDRNKTMEDKGKHILDSKN